MAIRTSSGQVADQAGGRLVAGWAPTFQLGYCICRSFFLKLSKALLVRDSVRQFSLYNARRLLYQIQIDIPKKIEYKNPTLVNK